MKNQPLPEEPLVRVARIGKPHGIRGEVTVEVFTDAPDARFLEGNVLEVRSYAKPSRFDALTVEKARWNKKILLLKFYEISDRNTAESLRNHELYAHVDGRVDDEVGWYASDLIGFSVHIGSFGKETVGEVVDLLTSATQDLLEVRLLDGREVLIPFVEEIVPGISEESQALIINPPAGLLELNQD